MKTSNHRKANILWLTTKVTGWIEDIHRYQRCTLSEKIKVNLACFFTGRRVYPSDSEVKLICELISRLALDFDNYAATEFEVRLGNGDKKAVRQFLELVDELSMLVHSEYAKAELLIAHQCIRDDYW